jgi:hypothetical protein
MAVGEDGQGRRRRRDGKQPTENVVVASDITDSN